MAEVIKPDGTRKVLTHKKGELFPAARDAIGGYVQPLYLKSARQVLLVDEDGLYKPQLLANPTATDLMKRHAPHLLVDERGIVGTVVLCSYEEFGIK